MLREGTGWEVEHPRDVWRLHTLPGLTMNAGHSAEARNHLRFDRLSQPWLRPLAKRWCRLRLGLDSPLRLGGLACRRPRMPCCVRGMWLYAVRRGHRGVFDVPHKHRMITRWPPRSAQKRPKVTNYGCRTSPAIYPSPVRSINPKFHAATRRSTPGW